jgi:hypothetical protein
MGEMKNVYRILFEKPQWETPLEIPRRRLKDNIRTDRREII